MSHLLIFHILIFLLFLWPFHDLFSSKTDLESLGEGSSFSS